MKPLDNTVLVATAAQISDMCSRSHADGYRMACAVLRDSVNKAQEFGHMPASIASLMRDLVNCMEAAETRPGIADLPPPRIEPPHWRTPPMVTQMTTEEQMQARNARLQRQRERRAQRSRLAKLTDPASSQALEVQKVPDEVIEIGRRSDGRFVPGCKGGPGRKPGPTFKNLIEARLKATGGSLEDVLFEIFEALLERAKKGDVGAAQLLLKKLAADHQVVSVEVDRKEIES